MAGAKRGEGDESANGFTIAHLFAFGRSRTHTRTGTEQLIAIVAPDTEPAERT